MQIYSRAGVITYDPGDKISIMTSLIFKENVDIELTWKHSPNIQSSPEIGNSGHILANYEANNPSHLVLTHVHHFKMTDEKILILPVINKKPNPLHAFTFNCSSLPFVSGDIPDNLSGINNSVSRIWDELSGSTLVSRLNYCLSQFGEPPKYIVDLASGYGRVALRLAEMYENANVIGMDVNRDAINYSNSVGMENTNFIQTQNMCPLPCDDNSQDLVTANSLFSHFNKDQEKFYLAECNRILKPGGKFYISILNGLSEEILPLTPEVSEKFQNGGRVEVLEDGQRLRQFDEYGYNARFLSYLSNKYICNQLTKSKFKMIQIYPSFADILTGLICEK